MRHLLTYFLITCCLAFPVACKKKPAEGEALPVSENPAAALAPACNGKLFVVTHRDFTGLVTEDQKSALSLCFVAGPEVSALRHNVSQYEKLFAETYKKVNGIQLVAFRINTPRQGIATVTTQRPGIGGPGYENTVDLVWRIKEGLWQPYELDISGETMLIDINGDKNIDLVILSPNSDGVNAHILAGRGSGEFVRIDEIVLPGDTSVTGKEACDKFIIKCEGYSSEDTKPAPSIYTFDCRQHKLVETTKGACSHSAQ